MFKIKIKSKVHGEPFLLKETQAEVDAYLAEIEQSQHWGAPALPIVDEMGQPTGEMSVPEYSVEVVDVTAEVEQEKVNKECLAYLAETDYLIIRELDNGVKCPEDVKAKRQECRSKIVK